MTRFRDLIERQIQKARLSGQMQGLEGKGRPLPHRPGDAFVSAGDAAGFRIMAEAGVLPEEIVLKKRMDALRARTQAVTDPAERRVVMAELADLELRHNIAREARQRFLRP